MAFPSLARTGARRLYRTFSTAPRCRQVCLGSPPSFVSRHFNSLEQSRDAPGRILSQQVSRSAHFIPSRNPAMGSIGLSHLVRSQGTSLFALGTGELQETVRQPTLLPMTLRCSVLPRQTVLNIRRQCISTDIFPKSMKSFTDRLTQPLDGMKQMAAGYKEAAGLQVEAFWKRNTMIFIGAVGVLACYLLWRTMFAVANVFVGFSEGMAKFGFLAMAAATVAFTGMMLKARFTINPDRVYSIAMRKLNMSAAALEVLGAPLTGTDLRAYVMSSGGLRLKKFRPKFGGKRCFLIFPIQGSDRRGLVSAEVKKRKGQYDFKLLAVDVANPGADQRLYIIGDEAEYRVGGGLISELRDPILKAMAAQKEFEAQDEKEEEEEAKEEQARREKELKEEEARRKEEVERLEREAAG